MRHPYVGLNDQQFWKKEPGVSDPALLDPVSAPPFLVTKSDRLVTAGSCFAQHVARCLSEAGFNHHITETAHAVIPPDLAKKHNYGMFAARYGNIYTARQLNQLLQRAFGTFTPDTSGWSSADGKSVVDPFRPQIQPDGYLSDAELEADRTFHLKCVRRAIEEMDVFIFTLGLTEAWVRVSDGAVLPLAPGVAGGRYDPKAVEFRNFDETESWDDLNEALTFIRSVRPNVRIILTVSPVPLNATYEARHVLQSTAWSKSVLRLVAEKATKHFEDCFYFPSFEIITSPHVRGRYFAPDCREVTAEGVSHVMSLFFSHCTEAETEEEPATRAAQKPSFAAQHHNDMEEAIDLLCDEASIDNM